MDNDNMNWPERFGLTVCAATGLETAIPGNAPGVAVIYSASDTGERIFLVIESRAGDLRGQCVKRLRTAKLPPIEELMIGFRAEPLADPSPGAVHAACREQFILAGELRRALRPAMR